MATGVGRRECEIVLNLIDRPRSRSHSMAHPHSHHSEPYKHRQPGRGFGNSRGSKSISQNLMGSGSRMDVIPEQIVRWRRTDHITHNAWSRDALEAVGARVVVDVQK